MKLDNLQTYVTNPQFSGGLPVGSGSLGATAIARNSVSMSAVIGNSGSFSVVNPFNKSYSFVLTGSADAVDSATTFFVQYSGSAGDVNNRIASKINSNSSVLYITAATGSTTTVLNVSASFGGVDGNAITISGSALANGSGTSNWPYNLPFVAGGLYIAIPGQLNVTTVDGSRLTFISASGFIPGLISAVSSSSTALGIVALK